MAGNPVVHLNYAIAKAMAQGAAAGLAELEVIEAEGSLRQHHRFYAVRGHLREMAADLTAAIADYFQAAGTTASLPERNYLLQQAARLRG